VGLIWKLFIIGDDACRKEKASTFACFQLRRAH